MKLIQEFPGRYTTEDGRYTVHTEESVTDCDGPHPVRFSKEERYSFARLSDWDKQKLGRRNWEKYMALLSEKSGYVCRGDSEHAHRFWTIWDNQANNYAGNAGVLDLQTFAECVSWLEEELGVKVEVKRPRAQKAPTPAPVEDSPAPAPEAPEPAEGLSEAHRVILEDELRGLEENIARFGHLLADPDESPFVDTELLTANIARRHALVRQLGS